MARITDTERGARIAQDAALDHLHPDLFPELMGGEQLELWESIFVASCRQLDECKWSREVSA